MATANLTAKISLDHSAFTKGLEAMQAKMAAVGHVLTGTAAKVSAAIGGIVSVAVFEEGIKHALEFGETLSNLAARTSAPIKDLVILREAFRESGLAADSVGHFINKMQKSLSGLDARGLPTVKTFQALGLSMDDLKKLSPQEQFEKIGKAIAALPTPAERAAAAIGIFGRSGGELLALFNNPEAFGNAAKMLGSQADILAHSAEAFKRVNEVVQGIGVKIQGFFVGVADSLLPAMESAANFFRTLDLAPIGKRLGDAINKAVTILVNAFKGGQLAELFGLSIETGAVIGMDYLIKSLRAVVSIIQESLGQAFAILAEPSFWESIQEGMIAMFAGAIGSMIDAFEAPLKALRNGLTFVFELAFNFMQSKFMKTMTSVMKWVATANPMFMPTYFAFKGMTEGETRVRSMDEITESNKNLTIFGGTKADFMGVAEIAFKKAQAAMTQLAQTGVLSAEAMKKAFTDAFKGDTVFSGLSEDLKKKLFEMAQKLSTPLGTGGGETKPIDLSNDAAQAIARHAQPIEGDRLARLGGFINGSGGIANSAISFARRTADNTAKIASLLSQKTREQIRPTVAWAQ